MHHSSKVISHGALFPDVEAPNAAADSPNDLMLCTTVMPQLTQ